MITIIPPYISRLHGLLIQCYDPDDLKTLCLVVDVNYNLLAGEHMGQRVTSLLKFLIRENRLEELIVICKKDFSNHEWDRTAEEIELEKERVVRGIGSTETNEDLQVAIHQCGSLLRQHKHTLANTDIHLEREIVTEIVSWLLEDGESANNVAMLLDQAGMGKTVVMNGVLRKLENQGSTVLAIKADLQLSDVTSIVDFQHKLGLPENPELAISRLAKAQRILVLIDQIDALSLSLAHDQVALNAVLDFIARLRQIPNARILISCRLFDRNTDPRLKQIDLDREFQLKPLPIEQVSEILKSLPFDPEILSLQTKELLRVPLHLDLFIRGITSKSSSTYGSLGSVTTLQDLYALILNNIVFGHQIGSPPMGERREAINQMVRYMDEHQCTSVPHFLLQSNTTITLDRAVNWLASIGILIQGQNNWSFLHQTFFDYCYAQQFVENDNDIVLTILNSSQGIFERAKLFNVISYLRGVKHHKYIWSLSQLLTQPQNLRFHLFDWLLRWFGALPNPTELEWEVAQNLLRDEQKRKLFLSAIQGNADWFEFLKPLLERWFTSQNVSQAEQSCLYLSSITELKQEEITEFLQPHADKNDKLGKQVLDILFSIKNWRVEKTLEVYERLIFRLSPLNYQLTRQVEHILDFNPEVGCKLLRYILDQSLEQYMIKNELDSQKERVLTHYFRLDDLFSEMRSLRVGLETSLKKASMSHPKLFIEAILPWVINVLSTFSQPSNGNRFASDLFSHHWHEETSGIKLVLIHSLLDALKKVAQLEPDYFILQAQRLMELPYQTPQQFLTHVYRVFPKQYTNEAYHFFVSDIRRFDIGDLYQYDSRKLVTSISPYLTSSQIQQLEGRILNYMPSYKRRGLRGLQASGIEQYYLLSAIPKHLLSNKGLKRFQEWERKFAGHKIPIEPPKMSEVGSVESPIEKNIVSKMSLKDWLGAMDKYQGGKRHRDFFKGGSLELSRLMVSQIQTDPEKFYDLYHRMPDNIDHVYAAAFVTGFAEAGKEQFLFDAVFRFAYREKGEIKQVIANGIRKCATNNVPNAILDLLIDWIHAPSDDDEWWWVQGDNHGDAFSSYFNSTRGAAFNATMRVLDAQNTPNARERKWELIEFVSADPSTALRIGAIQELIYMIQHDRARAWNLFALLISGHEVLLETSYVYDFLYWSLYKNFMGILPYAEQMMSYSKEEVQTNGAQLICVAFISREIFETDEAFEVANQLAEAISKGLPAWRRGAAHIYSHNMVHGTNDRARSLCQMKLTELIDDEDSKVKEWISHIWSGMKDDHFVEGKDFVEAYALSENHALNHQFAKYLWKYGMQDPIWALDIVQIVVQKNQQPEPWFSGIEEFIRLVLLIYASPLTDRKAKEKAMDAFDLLMQRYARTANNILAEWDT
ncbi:MAG: ATP-binding protein [Chloroflexi bacterium]|nr:ATP-binding protein [Chloroflexota bacterium]